MASSRTVSDPSLFRVRLRTAWRGLAIPDWLFALFGVLLVGTLVLLGLLAVVAYTYSGTQSHPDRTLDRGWGLLSVIALLWALANLHWLTKAADLNNRTATCTHLAVAIGCGLIALGIHAVLIAHTIASQPIVMDYSDSGWRAAGGPAAAVVEGDAESGRKIFSTTCITCHGPTGGGMPNLAPSLRGSEFIAASDATTIGNVIRLGRTATDPNNKTKKVMPARGGNPFLGDDKIVHLVAYVQAIQKEGPEEASGTQDPNAPPPAQLAKWVLPDSPPPPTGMIKLASLTNIGDQASIATRNQDRRLGLVRFASLGLAGIHCLLLLGVMMASSNVLLRELMSDSGGLMSDASDEDRTCWSWAVLGWSVVTLVWIVVFLFAFVIM